MRFTPGLSPAGYAIELRKTLNLIGKVDPFEIAELMSVPVYYEDLDEIDGCLLPGTPQKVLAMAWVENVKDQDQTLLEESIAIYSLGMVLSLIYTEDSEEDDEAY